MSGIRPNKDQFLELMHAPDDGPVVMLNLLKFKPTRAASEEYGKYGDSAVQMVEARGGKVLWMGKVDQTLIGDRRRDWDAIALVQYPSRKAFIEMTTSTEYDAAHEHREGGLERTVLLACTERVSTPRARRERVPMGRKILFITTDQQRYDSLGCNGGTIARTPVVDALAARRHQLPPRLQPEHGVHAGSLDDAHGPVRAHARRGRERRAASQPTRRASPSISATVPAIAPRCSARRTSSRASICSTSGPRTSWRSAGSTGPYRGFEHAELAMHVPTVGKRALQHYGRGWSTRTASRRDEGVLAAARRRARRRDRRARDAHQPDPARVVPHRLGRRSHDRVPRFVARRRRLVRVDVVPRPAPPVGSARVGAAPVQLARPRPAARSSRIERGDRARARAEARALAGDCGKARS